MVCDRCVRVVKEELEKSGLTVKNIKLGEAEVESANQVNIPEIKEILEKNGFELLEERNAKLIAQIKSLVIQLVHHNREELKENYSAILSKEIGRDYHYLSHLFSSVENITIEKYIIFQKIEKVKELLVYGELTLSEIAWQMGYSSVSHLSSQFRQVTGMSPTEFKNLKNRDRKGLDQI